MLGASASVTGGKACWCTSAAKSFGKSKPVMCVPVRAMVRANSLWFFLLHPEHVLYNNSKLVTSYKKWWLFHSGSPAAVASQELVQFKKKKKRCNGFNLFFVFTNDKFAIKMPLLHILTNASFYSIDVNLHRLLNHRFFNNFKIVLCSIQESSVWNSSQSSTARRQILSIQNTSAD